MEDLKRYSVEISNWDAEKVSKLVSSLNRLNWKFSDHFVQQLKVRFEDSELLQVGAVIKSLVLKPEHCFEYYVNNGGLIEKAVFQVPYKNNELLKLVVSSNKRIVSIWSNGVNDKQNIDLSRYEQKGVIQHAV